MVQNYESNREGERELIDEVRGEDRAVHRVDVLNENLSSGERAQGWSHFRAAKGTSVPSLEHPEKRIRRRRDTRPKRR
jgi:hypothetical protein